MGAKKVLKTAVKIYLAAYLGLTAHAVYDYSANNKKKIATEAKNSLVIRKYKVDLEGKVKDLTIVGETHIYNHTESKFAKELLKDYEHVAYEGGSGNLKDISFLEYQYWKAFALVYALPTGYYSLGSGRSPYNPSIRSVAIENNKQMHFLESEGDDILKNMSFGQKSVLLAFGVISALEAPMGYYAGKQDLEFGDKKIHYEDNSMFYAANLHARDKIMADNIEELLKREDINKIICVMGKAHVLGVEKNLKEDLNMKKVNGFAGGDVEVKHIR